MAGLLSNEKYSLYYQKVGLLYQRPEIKASLEVVLSIFTVTILIFAAIRPTLTNIASLQKKIEDQEATNKKADNKIQQLFQAQKQLSDLSAQLPLYDRAVPDTFSFHDVAKRIELLASRNSLVLDSMTIEGRYLTGNGKPTSDLSGKIVVTKNSLQELTVDFSVIGVPSRVISFIKSVENMDRFGVTQNVTLAASSSKGQQKNEIKGQAKMLFYFYGENK